LKNPYVRRVITRTEKHVRQNGQNITLASELTSHPKEPCPLRSSFTVFQPARNPDVDTDRDTPVHRQCRYSSPMCWSSVMRHRNAQKMRSRRIHETMTWLQTMNTEDTDFEKTVSVSRH